MTPPVTNDLTAGFAGEVLGPVPIDEAASRIRVYCTSRYSGWAVYDLAGVSARSAGLLTEVTTWSLLFANALNGRVELTQLADSTGHADASSPIGSAASPRTGICTA